MLKTASVRYQAHNAQQLQLILHLLGVPLLENTTKTQQNRSHAVAW